MCFLQYWYDGDETGDLPVDFSIVWDGDFFIDKPPTMKGMLFYHIQNHTFVIIVLQLNSVNEKSKTDRTGTQQGNNSPTGVLPEALDGSNMLSYLAEPSSVI